MDVIKTEEVPKVKIDLVDLDSGPKEEAIRVCTRMRPLFEKELNQGHIKAWKVQETDMLLIVEPPSMQEMLMAREPKKGNKKEDKKKIIEKSEGQKAVIQRHYVFDRCFDDNIGNEEVYNILARDIVLDTFKGINGCILAYGQTGSGKTHSVMGVPVDPGMLPRSLAEFFDVIENPSILNEENTAEKEAIEDNDSKEFLMRVTYLEVYMERVNDLLQEGPRGGAVENLDVKEDPKRGFVVIGIQEETVTYIDEVMLLVAKAEQRRHIAQTNFNETSSRSHTIFTVLLESNQVSSDGTSVNKRGELKIVDLAGNERAGRAAEGVENAKTVLEEGKAINKSLFVLSEVISKLSKRAQAVASGDEKKIKRTQEDLVFIPWRDSKLTRILSKSLGGNCRASVIVAVHPSHLYLDTSFSTLRFALKCKTIKKKIEVNFLSPEQSVIMQQKELIAKLQNQLKHLATSKNIDPDMPFVEGTYAGSRKPEDDEKVLALKKELEDKVKKFQNFILKSELRAKTHTNFRAMRSIDTNSDKPLKYLMTLSENMQNEFTWLRSFGTHEFIPKWDKTEKYEQDEEEKINITKAMDYLKNKSPYKRSSSGESDPSTDNSEKIDECITMNYYNELDQLEKLENDALNKMQKKDKSAGTNKLSNKEYDDLNKMIESKEGSLLVEDGDGDRDKDRDRDVKKKDKSKKKTGKVVPGVLEKDASVAMKKGDKGKLKVKAARLIKGKKGKGKKDVFEKSTLLQKSDAEEQGIHELSSVSKDEDFINVKKKKDRGDVVKGKGELTGAEGGEKQIEKKVVVEEEEEEEEVKGDEDEEDEEKENEKKEAVEKNKMEVSREEEIHEDGTVIQHRGQDTCEFQRTSIINNLKQKIAQDLKKKKKIYERNIELNKQIRFVMKLMQKVGLSAMLTGVVPPGRNVENVLRLRENLKDKLKLIGNQRSPKTLADINVKGRDKREDLSKKADSDFLKENEDMFQSYLEYTIDDGTTKENVTSLSHVFINEMFYSFIWKLHQKDAPEDALKQMENEIMQGKGQFDASNQSLEKILGTQIARDVYKIEDIFENVDKASAKDKNAKNVSHGNTNSKSGKAYNNSSTSAALSKKEEKGKDTIESILNLLTPWEQKILALLYEQQKMRKDVQDLKKSFADRIKNINMFIKKILIDKVEVEAHFKRVVETIEQYKQDLLKTSDIDSNFKFANLMKKLEDLSISLAEKNRDFNVLAEFHINLRKSLQEKENLIKQLQEENKLFYLVPKYAELLKKVDAEGGEESEHIKELKKEFLLMYGRLMMTKKKLEEKEVIENDMRNLNTPIYSELIESITVIKNLESQYKFLEIKTNREKKKQAEKIRNLISEKMKLNKVIDEMKKKLQEANIDADELKENIIANCEVPEINIDLEEEGDEAAAANKNAEQTEETLKNKNTETKCAEGEVKKTEKEGSRNVLKGKKKKKMQSKDQTNHIGGTLLEPRGKTVAKKNVPTGAINSLQMDVDKVKRSEVAASLKNAASNGIPITKKKKVMETTILKKKDAKKKMTTLLQTVNNDNKKNESKSTLSGIIKNKKAKKKKTSLSDEGYQQEKAESKSSYTQQKKKKNKGKKKTKTLTLKSSKKKGNESSESIVKESENELNELKSDNSDTHRQTNEIRELLTLEIEKKKKADVPSYGTLSVNGTSRSTTSARKVSTIKKT